MKDIRSLSKPAYAVKVEKDVFVPMRDGAKLATDVFRPDAPGKIAIPLSHLVLWKRLSIGSNTRESHGEDIDKARVQIDLRRKRELILEN